MLKREEQETTPIITEIKGFLYKPNHSEIPSFKVRGQENGESYHTWIPLQLIKSDKLAEMIMLYKERKREEYEEQIQQAKKALERVLNKQSTSSSSKLGKQAISPFASVIQEEQITKMGKRLSSLINQINSSEKKEESEQTEASIKQEQEQTEMSIHQETDRIGLLFKNQKEKERGAFLDSKVNKKAVCVFVRDDDGKLFYEPGEVYTSDDLYQTALLNQIIQTVKQDEKEMRDSQFEKYYNSMFEHHKREDKEKANKRNVQDNRNKRQSMRELCYSHRVLYKRKKGKLPILNEKRDFYQCAVIYYFFSLLNKGTYANLRCFDGMPYMTLILAKDDRTTINLNKKVHDSSVRDKTVMNKEIYDFFDRLFAWKEWKSNRAISTLKRVKKE